MPTRLFTIAYGNAFADLYERIAVRSLLQSRNREALSNIIVSLYSDAETMPRVAEVAKRLGQVDPHVIELEADPARAIQSALLNEIKICLDTKSTMIIVNPENFWGDGSLPNLLAIAGEQDVCVAAPHVRVCKNQFIEFIDDINQDILNANLVHLSMISMHPSWGDANADNPQTSTFHAGISWRKIAHNLYAVTHLLPTVFLARFNAADYGYFKSGHERGAVGLWDHFWPERLVESGRERVIGSSDAFFLVELTDPETHNVPLKPNDPKCPSAFYRGSSQTHAMRNLTAIWRAI